MSTEPHFERYGLARRLHFLLLAYVERDGQGRLSELGKQRIQRRPIGVGNDDAVALGNERPRYRIAQRAARSGDQRDSALVILVFVHLELSTR